MSNPNNPTGRSNNPLDGVTPIFDFGGDSSNPNPDLTDSFTGEQPVVEPTVDQPQAVAGEVGEKEPSRDRNEAIESLRQALISALPKINKGKGSPEWLKARYEDRVDNFVNALRGKDNILVPDAENDNEVLRIANQIDLAITHDNKIGIAREKIQRALTEQSNKVKAAVASALATISFAIGIGGFSSRQANAVTAYDPAPIEQADANNEAQSGDETGEPGLAQQIQEQNDFINGRGQATKQTGEAEASESNEAEAQAEQESAGGGVIEANLNDSINQSEDSDGGNGKTAGEEALASAKTSILNMAKEVKKSLGGLSVSDDTLHRAIVDALRVKGMSTTPDTVKNILDEAKEQGVDLDVETDKDATKAEEVGTNKDTKAEEAETAAGYDFEATVDGVNQSLHFDKRVDGYNRENDPFYKDADKLSPGSFVGPTGSFMETMNKIVNSSAPLSLYLTAMQEGANGSLADVNFLANKIEGDEVGYADAVNALQEFFASRLDGGTIETKTISAGTRYMTYYSWNSEDGMDDSHVYAQPDLVRQDDIKVVKLLDAQGKEILDGMVKECVMKDMGIPEDQWGEWHVYLSLSCGQLIAVRMVEAEDGQVQVTVVNVDEQVGKTNYETPQNDVPTTVVVTTPDPDTPTPDTPTPDTPDIPEVDHSKSGDPNAGDYQQYMDATDRKAETTKQNYEAVNATEDNHVDPDVAPGSEVYDVSTNYASNDMYVVDNVEQAYENNSLDTAYEASTEGWQEGAVNNTGQDFSQNNEVTEDYTDPNSIGTVSRFDYETDNGVSNSDAATDASSEAGGME